jgi:dTDP-4-dehydrorhamnose 3,5-epimerase-like enzyme
MIYIEPSQSKLGIKINTLEIYANTKGVLQVAFRYNPSDLSKMANGMQVQYENILENQFRGNHYHYPDFAGEEFFLIKGYALLITCDVNSENFELYLLKERVSYFIPAFVAHKVINIGNKFGNKEDVEFIISKHYNHSIESLQTPFEIFHKDLEAAINKLITKSKNEKLQSN